MKSLYRITPGNVTFWFLALFIGYFSFLGIRYYEYRTHAQSLVKQAVNEALDAKLGDPPSPAMEKILTLPEGRFKDVVRDEFKQEVLRRGRGPMRRILLDFEESNP